MAALELLTRAELIPSRHFPPPGETLRALAGELDGASLWSDLASTLEGWAIGLALAIVVAVPLGIAIGSSALLYRSLRFTIEFLRPIPSVALIPLVVLDSEALARLTYERDRLGEQARHRGTDVLGLPLGVAPGH